MNIGRLYLVAAGIAMMLGAPSLAREVDQAAPGSPLYDKAVLESISGLAGRDREAAHARPPSPGPDYYWCDHCKTYHQRKPAAGQAGAAVHAPAAAAVGAAGGVRPPSPGPDYYWCDSCKTYHKRQASAAAGPAEGTAATPGASGERPPLPGPDYYWCKTCRTYHRQPDAAGAGASPPHGHAHPPQSDSSAVGKAFGGEYYYCDQCKTYHRRPAAASEAKVDVSRIVGGVSNRPNANPLAGSVGAGP